MDESVQKLAENVVSKHLPAEAVFKKFEQFASNPIGFMWQALCPDGKLIAGKIQLRPHDEYELSVFCEYDTNLPAHEDRAWRLPRERYYGVLPH